MTNRNEIRNFGERLSYLIDSKFGDGLSKKWGIFRTIANDMMEGGYIVPDDEQDIEKCINSTARSISNHMKGQSCDSPSGKWINVYAKYFDCSTDYLRGKIEEKNHETHTANEITGLSEPAIELLNTWKTSGYNELTGQADLLSRIIIHEDFPKLLNYIMKYRNAINPEPMQIEQQKTWAALNGIEEPETAVQQSNCDRADTMWMRSTNMFQNIITDISNE